MNFPQNNLDNDNSHKKKINQKNKKKGVKFLIWVKNRAEINKNNNLFSKIKLGLFFFSVFFPFSFSFFFFFLFFLTVSKTGGLLSVFLCL